MALVDVVRGVSVCNFEWSKEEQESINRQFRLLGIGDDGIWEKPTVLDLEYVSPELTCIPEELRPLVSQLKNQDSNERLKRYKDVFVKYSKMNSYPSPGSDLGAYYIFFRNLHFADQKRGDGSYELQLIIHYLVTGTNEKQNPQWTVACWTRGSLAKYKKLDKKVQEDVKARRRMIRAGPTGRLDVKYSNYIGGKVIREPCSVYIPPAFASYGSAGTTTTKIGSPPSGKKAKH